MITAYCMKCREKREMNDPQLVIHRNNRSAFRGICAVCGTTVFRMGGPAQADQDWREEWKEMPEFVQEVQTPYSQIMFRFASKQDLRNFSRLIGQKLTKHTKSAWHPELERGKNACKRWIDES